MSQPAPAGTAPPPPATDPMPERGRRPDRAARLIRGAILLGILVAATLLRFHGITRHALWGDEFLTLEACAGHAMEHEQFGLAGFVQAPDLMTLSHAGPWWRVATTLARNDKHPPLYFLLERAWWEIAGDSPLALRSLSLAFSVAAVALLYLAAEPLVGAGAALWAAALMAVSIPQIHYAQEGRMYALLLALMLGACAALARLEKRGPGRLRAAALGACLLGMMLTHYFAAAPCIALAIYAAFRLRGAALRQAIVAAVAAALAYAILWGPLLAIQWHNLNDYNWWLVDNEPGHLKRTLMYAALIPARMLAEPRPSAEWAAAAAAVLFIVPPFLLRRQPGLLMWWLLLVISPLPSLVTDLLPPGRRQLEWVRYVLPAAPAVFVLLSATVPPRWPRLRPLIPAAGVLLCILNLPAGYAVTENFKPDWRPMVAMVQRLAEPSDIMVFCGADPRERGYGVTYYLALAYYDRDLPKQVLFPTGRDGMPTPEEVAQLRRRAPAIWLVIPWGSPPQAPEGFAPGPKTGTYTLPSIQRWTRTSSPPPSTKPSS